MTEQIKVVLHQLESGHLTCKGIEYNVGSLVIQLLEDKNAGVSILEKKKDTMRMYNAVVKYGKDLEFIKELYLRLV